MKYARRRMSSSVGNAIAAEAETVLVELFLVAFFTGAFLATLTATRRVFGAETSGFDVAFAAGSLSFVGVLVFRGTVVRICVSD